MNNIVDVDPCTSFYHVNNQVITGELLLNIKPSLPHKSMSLDKSVLIFTLSVTVIPACIE